MANRHLFSKLREAMSPERRAANAAASFAVTVCGEDRSGARRKPRVKRASAK